MWNETWGEMIWGNVASVPSLSAWAALLLAGALIALGTRRIGTSGGRGHVFVRCATWVLPPVLLVGGLGWAQVVSVPHVFTNGTRADAVQVNQNFQSVVAAINQNRNELRAGRSVVMESEFRANRPTAQVLFGLNGGGAAIMNGASETFISTLVAPTHVPAGARISQVEFYFRDTDTALNVEVCLYSYEGFSSDGYVNFGCIKSAGTPGSDKLTFAPPTSDQEARFFELRISAENNAGTTVAWPGTSLQARGAVISYTFD